MHRTGATTGRSRRSRGEPAACGQGGFAYLWLLIIIVILGLGLTRTAEIHATAQQRDREAQLLEMGHAFRAAIASYHAVGKAGVASINRYPPSLEDLLDDKRFPMTKRHLRKVPVDPFTGASEWGLLKVGNRIVGIHSLSDRKPLKQASFEPEDSALGNAASLREWWFTHPPDIRLQINASSTVKGPSTVP